MKSYEDVEAISDNWEDYFSGIKKKSTLVLDFVSGLNDQRR